MNRSRIAATALCVGLATSLVAAPAQALESTVKDGTCSITLSIDENTKWKEATGKKNNIDEGAIMPFSVKVEKAKAVKANFEKQFREIDFQENESVTKLSVGDYADDNERDLLIGNVAVIDQIQALAPNYKSALDACANNSGFKSDENVNKGTGQDTTQNDRSTSSTMNETTKTALYSLLGLAVFTAIAAVVANGGIPMPAFF